MTRISLVALLQEHASFSRGLLKLIVAGAYPEAAYITAIIQTDLAEIGQAPPDTSWVRPGDAAPADWPIYQAALHWCHERGYPQGIKMRGWLSLPWRRGATLAAPTVMSPAPVVPAPASKKAMIQNSKRPIIVVTVLGLQGDALTEVIETVIGECDQAATRPLFITDGSNFGPFRSGRSLFEQVVDVEACRVRRPELNWSAYGEKQYRLIGRKWKPVTTIAFGRPPDPAFVEAMMQGVREKL